MENEIESFPILRITRGGRSSIEAETARETQLPSS